MLISQQNAFAVGPHLFETEASLLGLPPGKFPRTIPTNLGNALNFVFQRFVIAEGEVIGAEYLQTAGCVELMVHND